ETRECFGRRYTELLTEHCPEVTPPYTEPFNNHVYAQYTVRVPKREAVAATLKSKNIPTVVHYPKSIHQQKIFHELYGEAYAGQGFPVAEAAAREVLSLPMHPYLKDEDQVFLVKTLATALKNA